MPICRESAPRGSWSRPAFVAAAISFLICCAAASSHAAAFKQLDSSFYARVWQSTDWASTNVAAKAVDGSTNTFAVTTNAAGSFWAGELLRRSSIQRVELVNRPAPADAEMGGLTLRLYDIDDQIVYESAVTNPGPSGTWAVDIAQMPNARTIWVGLVGAATNDSGNQRVGLAEVRVFGDYQIPFGPAPLTNISPLAVTATQSSELGGYPASNGLDGYANTFTHTGNFSNSWWMADLKVTQEVTRIEIVNRADCCDNRLGGLTVRVLDPLSNSVYSTIITNPGLGKTWTNFPTAGTTGRYVKVGLENGALNGGGNYYVTLAEARFYSGSNQIGAAILPPVPPTGVVNYAYGTTSYMVRLTASLAGASNANDNAYSTEAKTTTQTVDGYWEVDLGATYAIYGTRAIAANGIGIKLTNTTLRLFDGNHESVYSRFLYGTPDVFDSDVNGPYFARYVRIGLEDKKRTDPNYEWYIGFREVEVFGRPTNEVGIQSFTISTNQIAAGQPVTMSWFVEDVRRMEIHPTIGSVGALTAFNGIGSITQQPATSVEYILIASNTAGVFTKAVGVQVGTIQLPVLISEFVADNKYSLEDGNGNAEDWIELRNTGNSNVNLAGWSLSDDPLISNKWKFPATNIPAHGTLIVFASGSSTSNDAAGNLHANFKLNSDGGSLLLCSPAGTVVDAFTNYPALDTDLAYGRDIEGNRTFIEPTPGAVNLATTYQGWLKSLKFSHTRGFYDSPFTLTISNSNAGASVFYSTNGIVPATPYSNGISIAGMKSIRAMVTKPGYKSPRIQTASFIFVDNVIASSVMSTSITQNASYAPRMRPGMLALPTVSMNLPGAPGYDEVEGSVEVLWPNASNENVQANCGISRFGGSWQDFNKRSFRADFRTKYGSNKLKTPFFDGFDRGILANSSIDSLEFRAGNQDMNARGFYMAGRFVEDSMLDMGTLNPHGRFVHLYLNGTYWGQYDTREPFVDQYLADYLGGSVTNYLTVKGNDNVGSNFVLGTPDAPRVQPWDRVYSLRSDYTNLAKYVDIPNLVDFMLLWCYGQCEGEFRCAGTVAAGSGFKFWIADADGFLRTGALSQDTTGANGPADLITSLRTQNHADFRTLFADLTYRHLFNNGALTPTQNLNRLNARMTEIHDSLLAECARWGYQTPTSWEATNQLICNVLFPAKTTQLVAQLKSRGLYPTNDPPAFNQYGGLVTNGFQPTLTTSSGTIYYTIDGSDPRLAGGAVSTNARVWFPGSISVTQDVTINARVLLSNGQWSAVAQPLFLLASRTPPTTRDLLLTEVNYNPAGSDDFEFIELYNAGTNLLDLSGVQFTNGVRFIFPQSYSLKPGAFTIVVESTNSFHMRYQDPASPWYYPGIAVAGEWTGSLANNGETIALATSNGVELLSVPYGTSGDWPERADGNGSTIELETLPSPTNDIAGVKLFEASGPNWTSSSLYNGSPGRLDTFVRTIKINEILTHTDAELDWVEIVNNGFTPADLSGLRLTDHYDQPMRFTIPNGTILQPGGLTNFGLAQLGFGFSELGSLCALLQTSGTNVIRFLDTVDCPAAEREEPQGVFEKSDGSHDFTELRAKTKNAANALPRIGPVVISEIHFAPTNGMAEFVELANITSSNVNFFHPVYQTNVWHLDGVGQFYFPTGTVIAPCAPIIVCSTSPAAFRAQYSVDPSVQVFGPFTGALDSSGETIKLMYPGDPELDGFVPYYRMDHVSFRTAAPWPAFVAGASIERQPLEGYGNDAAYWHIGSANGTPGTTRPNRAPQINATSVQVDEQTSFTTSVFAVDLDVPWQSVSITNLSLPAGASFNPQSGEFVWTPGELDGPGVFTSRFVAVDSAVCSPAIVTGELVVTVNEANRAPQWSSQPPVTIPAGVSIDIAPTATDPDLPAQSLSYRAEGLPFGIAADPNTGHITGSSIATGSYDIAIIAVDNFSPPLESTNHFTLTIVEPFVLQSRFIGGDGIHFFFPTLTSEIYRVETSESLALPDWQPLGVVTSPGGNLLEWIDPGPATSRYYRVKWIRN